MRRGRHRFLCDRRRNNRGRGHGLFHRGGRFFDSLDFDGLNLPRRSRQIAPDGPGVLIAHGVDEPPALARLQIGDKVSVKLDALPFVKHGQIDGRLRLVSEDTFEKGLNGHPGPVFRARVSLEKMALSDTPPGFRLVPGSTVSADIKVGTRKLITYFTYPILRSGSTSFREP